MLIEKGEYYKSRDGRKFGPMVIWKDGSNYPWSDNATNGTDIWTDDGKSYKGHDSSNDLVALWQEGPVRTRTVKEIVPGTYGHVYVQGKIEGHPLGNLCSIGVGGTKSAIALKAEELREAARIFNELADALDDGLTD